jgi:hypothetical protein
MRLSVPTRDGLAIALILIVSAGVGTLILAYGVAVRGICLDAGLGVGFSNLLAVAACAPILAALYSIET